jgi:hypothetical protein
MEVLQESKARRTGRRLEIFGMRVSFFLARERPDSFVRPRDGSNQALVW